MASSFSLVKSRSLYLVKGPMWQKIILFTIPHYSKIDWPMTLFCTRSPPFMSSDVIFLQAKWSKIKERVEGWKSGKKMWFKRITVCGVRPKLKKNINFFNSSARRFQWHPICFVSKKSVFGGLGDPSRGSWKCRDQCFSHPFYLIILENGQKIQKIWCLRAVKLASPKLFRALNFTLIFFGRAISLISTQQLFQWYLKVSRTIMCPSETC